MSKGKRLKGKRRRSGKGFIAEFSDRLTANFQKEIRNSELWDQMVAEFGKMLDGEEGSLNPRDDVTLVVLEILKG